MKAELQRFKENDDTERRVILVAMPILDSVGTDLDLFWDGAYSAYPLGDVLYDLGRDPMSGVITKDIYRKSYPAIHNLFTRPGTFEFYLEVFRAIWGPGVQVIFDIPSPGVLLIKIVALNLEEFNLVARRIEGDVYVYDEVITEEAENIIVRTTTGIKDESEIDALMNELSPEGIFVETTLTF